ncbi:MAG TPA: response regulator [Smithellaceae bacterium]|nr:response regulator [Smithellaceae bacterium]
MGNAPPVEILLVEDNPNDIELALRAFKKNKLVNHVNIVRDGEEALDYLFGRGTYAGRNIADVPTLILTDLNMPRVNGLELLKEIRSNPLTKNIPVVVLTTSREEQDVLDAHRLGINSYILKPVDFEQFMNSARLIGYHWMLLQKKEENNK